MLMPMFAGAQSTADLQALINSLMAQVKQLQAQLLAQQGGGTTPWCHTFNRNLGIGARGDEVKALHSVLEKEGITVNFTAGVEGPNAEVSVEDVSAYREYTASAVSGFQEKYRSEILTPNNLQNGTGYVGPSTRAKLNQLYGCNSATPPSIPTIPPVPYLVPKLNVLSPNGGVTWTKGTTRVIAWQDNIPLVMPICTPGSACPFPVKSYDLRLVPYYPPCTGNVCPSYPYIAPKPIANGVSGSTYPWKVGLVGYSLENNSEVTAPDGFYTIQVCVSGTSVCDSSDAPFTISSPPSPVIKNLDLDGGGVIDGYDSNLLADIVAGKASCPAGRSCDMNGDGVVNAADVLEYWFVNVPYDLNRDGVINSADNKVELAVINGATCPVAGKNSTYGACEINGDGVVNVYDLTASTKDNSSLSCVAPTGLSPSGTITASADGKINLSWQLVSDALYYNVRLDDGTGDRYDDSRYQTCMPNGTPHYYCENGIVGTSITGVPVTAGHTYKYWVDPTFYPVRWGNNCSGTTSVTVSGNGVATSTQTLLKVLSPNNGEVWMQGETRTISWSGNSLGYGIEIVKADGTSLDAYYGSGDLGMLDGQYKSRTWKVGSYMTQGSPSCTPTTCPDIPPGQYRFKITDRSSYDLSDVPFTIVASTVSDNIPPTIIITSPTAGVNLSAGATLIINADARDNVGINRVVFSGGSSLFGPDQTVYTSIYGNSVYSVSIPITASSPIGGHCVFAFAYDAAGNRASSESRCFNVVVAMGSATKSTTQDYLNALANMREILLNMLNSL